MDCSFFCHERGQNNNGADGITFFLGLRIETSLIAATTLPVNDVVHCLLL